MEFITDCSEDAKGIFVVMTSETGGVRAAWKNVGILEQAGIAEWIRGTLMKNMITAVSTSPGDRGKEKDECAIPNLV